MGASSGIPDTEALPLASDAAPRDTTATLAPTHSCGQECLNKADLRLKYG